VLKGGAAMKASVLILTAVAKIEKVVEMFSGGQAELTRSEPELC
jgi:hypothetical protein